MVEPKKNQKINTTKQNYGNLIATEQSLSSNDSFWVILAGSMDAFNKMGRQ